MNELTQNANQMQAQPVRSQKTSINFYAEETPTLSQLIEEMKRADLELYIQTELGFKPGTATKQYEEAKSVGNLAFRIAHLENSRLCRRENAALQLKITIEEMNSLPDSDRNVADAIRRQNQIPLHRSERLTVYENSLQQAKNAINLYFGKEMGKEPDTSNFMRPVAASTERSAERAEKNLKERKRQASVKPDDSRDWINECDFIFDRTLDECQITLPEQQRKKLLQVFHDHMVHLARTTVKPALQKNEPDQQTQEQRWNTCCGTINQIFRQSLRMTSPYAAQGVQTPLFQKLIKEIEIYNEIAAPNEFVATLYDYSFQRAIQEYNVAHKDEPNHMIQASVGPMLWKKLQANLETEMRNVNCFTLYRAGLKISGNMFAMNKGQLQNCDLAGEVRKATADVFMAAANRTLSECPLISEKDKTTPFLTTEKYSEYRKEARNYIQHHNADGTYAGLLPLSPFNENYHRLHNMKRCGTDFMFVPIESLESKHDLKDPSIIRYLHPAKPSMTNKEMTGWSEMETTTILTKDDLSGLSELSEYFSEETLAKYRRHVETAPSSFWANETPDARIMECVCDALHLPKGKTPEWTMEDWSDLTYSHQLELKTINEKSGVKALAILEHLEEDGYGYELIRDSRPGQLAVKLTDGSGLKIRIKDLPENSRWVGRPDINGASYNFYYKSGRGVVVNPNASITDTLNLIDFAMNKPLRKDVLAHGSRASGHEFLVGERFVKSNGKASSKTYGGMTALYGNLTDENSNEQQEVNIKCTITGDHRINVSSYKTEQRVIEEQKAANLASPQDTRTALSEADTEEILRKYSDWTQRKAETFDEYEKTPENLAKNRFIQKLKGSAEARLFEMVNTAKQNLEVMIDLDSIADLAAQHKDEEDYIPQFFGSDAVTELQYAYYDLLSRNEDDNVWLKPSVSQFEYEALVHQAKRGELSSEELKHLDDMVIRGSAAEVARQHAALYIQANTGEMYKDDAGNWMHHFNPAGVALYQTNDGFSVTRSQGEIASCFKSMGVTGDDLPYTDYDNETIREKLLRFDASTGRPMKDETNPFLQDMYRTICQSLTGSAVHFDEKDILIDDRGVVTYKFQTGKNLSKFNETVEFQGEIGQLWAPDEEGKIETHYAYTKNYYCLPGYRAYLQKQKPGENKSFRERIILKGYQQSMKEAIQQQIRRDILETAKQNNEHALCGSAVSLNRVFKKLYDTRWPLNYKEIFEKSKMPEDIVQAIIATETRSVRFDADFVKGSDITSQLKDSNKLKDYENGRIKYPDLANDRFGSAWIRSGRTQLSSLGEHLDGWADHHATGTGENQGRRIYLTEDAVVTPEGRVLPGKPGGQCPLIRLMMEQFYSEFDAADRVNMDFNNLKSAQTVTEPVYSAMMTFGGWTQDDGMVISKDMADQYPVYYESDEQIKWRPLEKGDKIDAHGNKGVISLVIDRSMSEEEAIKQGIFEQWKIFHDNPKLDLVMSPFSEVSRNNGGTYREMSASKADLINSSGERIPGGMGKLRLIVTDKTADEKTKVSEKNGRKFSAQLSWIVQAQDCPKVMKEVFASNTTAFMDAREVLMTLGISMSESGDLSNGITAEFLENRHHFRLPDPSTFKYQDRGKTKSSYALDNKKDLLSEIQKQMAVQGGVLELPFPIRLKNGDYTPRLENGTYALPVMSTHLRSGVKLNSGVPVAHDYSRRFGGILDKALDYVDCEERSRRGIGTWKDADKKRQAQKAAQNLYDEIAQDLEVKKIAGKHNMFREGIMAHKMPRSSTAIWTPDPRLKMNQIAVAREIAEGMGLKDGHSVFMWRDPTLHVRCAKYLDVTVQDDLHGIAVNPSMAASMDGDFDGDTIGMIALKTEEARQELQEKFGMQNSLINWGIRKEDDYGLPNFKFAFQTGIDIQAGRWLVKDRWEDIPENEKERFDRIASHTKEFTSGRQMYETIQNEWEVLDMKKNDYALQVSAGSLSGPELEAASNQLLDDCNRAILHAQMVTTGQCVISMNSPEEHVRSLEKYCVESGAKGSYNKVKTACTYAGIDYECDAENEQKMIPGTVTQAEHRLGDTAAMDRNQQTASYIKQAGTGFAGKQSQYAVRMIKSVMDHWKNEIDIMPFSPIQAALEATYFNTQRILQCKHDADEAVEFLENVQKLMPQIWSGKVLQKHPFYGWCPVSDGGAATEEQWVTQAYEIYQDMGIDINIQMLETCAHYLSIAGKGQGMPDLQSTDDLEAIADPLDQMAYDSSFARLKKLAYKGVNLFDGYCARQFVCKSVRQKLEEETAAEIQKQADVQKDDVSKNVSEQEKTEEKATEQPKAEPKKAEPRILSSADVLDGYTNRPQAPSAPFDVKELSQQIPKPRTDLPFSGLKEKLEEAGFEFEMD